MNTFNNSTVRTENSSKIMLPVVELVIAIGLFTIISVFIIRFFTSANLISRQASESSKGMIKAESVMELLKSFSPEEVAEKLNGKLTENKENKLIEVYCDSNLRATSIKDFKYVISASLTDTPKGNGILQDIRILIIKKSTTPNNEETIADIKGAKYIKGGDNEK